MDGISEEQRSGLTCLKVLVMGFNTIFMITGIMIISVGTTVYGVYYYFNQFLENQLFSPASLLVVTGSFIFLIAIIGFISVLKESTLMINTYCVLLCFIGILQITAGISAIVLRGRVGDGMHTRLNSTMHSYPYDHESAMSMDSLQKSLKCCGIFGPMDWRGIFSGNNLRYIFQGDVILPDSCCEEFDTTANICLATNMSGCFVRMLNIIFQTLRILVGTSFTLAIIQLTGISFTHRLARELIRIKSDRLARQMFMRNQMHNIYDAMGFHSNGTQYMYDKPPSYEDVVPASKK